MTLTGALDSVATDSLNVATSLIAGGGGTFLKFGLGIVVVGGLVSALFYFINVAKKK